MEVEPRGALQIGWVHAVCSSPWVEVIGVVLGVGTGLFLHGRDCKVDGDRRGSKGVGGDGRTGSLTEAALAGADTGGGDGLVECVGDGVRERAVLLERLARGLPVLGATWLWQLLNRLDGPPSLLDPLAAVLSWIFLEMVMMSIPPDVWIRWNFGRARRAKPTLMLPLAPLAPRTEASAAPEPCTPTAILSGLFPLNGGRCHGDVEEVAPLTPRWATSEPGARGSSPLTSAHGLSPSTTGKMKTASARSELLVESGGGGDGGGPGVLHTAMQGGASAVTSGLARRRKSMVSSMTGSPVMNRHGEASSRAAARVQGTQRMNGYVTTGAGGGLHTAAAGRQQNQQGAPSAVSSGASATTRTIKRRPRSLIGAGAMIDAVTSPTSPRAPGVGSGRAHATPSRPPPPQPPVSPLATPARKGPRAFSPTGYNGSNPDGHRASPAPDLELDSMDASAGAMASSSPENRPHHSRRSDNGGKTRPRIYSNSPTSPLSETRGAGGVNSKRPRPTITPRGASGGSRSAFSPTSKAPAAKKGKPMGVVAVAVVLPATATSRQQHEQQRRQHHQQPEKQEKQAHQLQDRLGEPYGGGAHAKVATAPDDAQAAVPTGVQEGPPAVGGSVWATRATLASSEFDGEEEGTTVPVKFRPPGREHDVLCVWSLDHLRKDEDVGMFARGAFGKVVAVRTEQDLQLAAKIVERSDLSPERYIERELELLEECSVHPHVVGLLGVIRTSSRVFVLMPLADTDLAAMIKSTRLDEKQAGFCVRQVVSAVEFLHERGIVHRDIKPANILVLSNKVLLADFGLAKEVPRAQPFVVGACGTKPYLAPELVRDLPYDASVDLWAIGVVTFELLHGYTPFRPRLVRPRSWDGVVREANVENNGAGPGRGTDVCGSGGRDGDGDGESLSVSESSGSIVNQRMFERSAQAPGGGLDRAWVAGRAHQGLLFGKEDEDGGADNGGRGTGRRRGHREADQLRLLDNIVRGEYRIRADFVGKVGADFIRKLLQSSPARRMPAARAAEHPWLGVPSKVPPRRRAARAEVAAVIAERAANTAERHNARVQASSGTRQAAVAVECEAAVEATEAAAGALSEISHLAASMAAEARAAQADVKRWEKAAVNAGTADASDDDGGGDHISVAEAVGKAEAAVQRAELLAKEARAGGAAAEAAANAWERAAEQEAEAVAAKTVGKTLVGDENAVNGLRSHASPEMRHARVSASALGASLLREQAPDCMRVCRISCLE